METEFERAKAAIEAMRIGAADTEEEIHMQAARMFEKAVDRLLVLAPRGVDLPNRIGGKPVTMMSLEKLWGISLP